MIVKITPSKLIGKVNAPSSKSFSHRMLIAAALSQGVSEISNINRSADIDATVEAMTALGAKIGREGNTYTVKGISVPAESAVIDCRESGSTMRFIIPVAAALGCSAEFNGRGKLPERPITPYKREMGRKGVKFDHTDGVMPFSISGKLRGGDYYLEGNVSSQFITGLLFALPLCKEDSRIILTSKLESKPYADMTTAALRRFGVGIDEITGEKGFPVYIVKGNRSYSPAECAVEGDYSQAAFFFAANALGSEVKIGNLPKDSAQGDKKIVDIIKDISADGETLRPFTADASDIPDLVPILTVLGCFTSGKSRIINAGRLKIKESDRLKAVSDALNAIGGNVTAGEDFLEISPVEKFKGGIIDGCNDHRIVMASAIAASMSEEPVIIKGCEAVSKSYPDFWKDFDSLGGCTEFFKE